MLKCSHTSPCEACRKARSACVPQSDRLRAKHRNTVSTEARIEKLPFRRDYVDERPLEITTSDEVHAGECTKQHRWIASNKGRTSVTAIPRENYAGSDSPTTCPDDITTRGEWNDVGDDRNSTLPSETGENAGWEPPSSAFALPDSYMPADNSTENPTADPWYSMPWTSEPHSRETLPASFWGWNWSQSGYLTGSETDGFLHPSIPTQQPGGRPFRGDAEEPQYPSRSGIMPFS
ncbi:hypothetical protein AnigIFM63604_004108 [Aspergillus niger]|uniref:Uncharacterized protein n=1 Tax=Aspergillus niger TaxID=5061 RepID=A0A9W6EGF2_ASPNG|nr:hypothetical protein AnigIFM63604_004108 [Aspergillus niger]